MGRYLGAFFAAAAGVGVLFAALAVLHFWFLGIGPDTELLRYQIAKAARAEAADTVLVGDSSLGNAIDAAAFGRLTGHRSISLALTGYFGYAGSYNMLRRALAANPVRNVVIMHTADIATRPVPYRGYLMTVDRWELRRFDWSERYGLALALRDTLFNPSTGKAYIDALLERAGFLREPHLAGDFIAQSPRLDLAHADFPLGPMRPGNGLFLDWIGALCRERALNCVFVHGPLYAPLIPAAATAIAGTDRLVHAAGIALANEAPVPLAAAMVGDAVNHVAPPDRPAMTEYYARLIGPALISAK